MATLIKTCPFCGTRPSGKVFCSSDRGPMLACDGCSADGPPPLEEGVNYVFSTAEEKRLKGKAIKKWNTRGSAGAE